MKTYVGMMRDIQYWYAVREGNDGAALQTSVLILSVLAYMNVMCPVYLIDELVNGRATVLNFHAAGKGILAGIGVVITGCNLLIAKHYKLPNTVEIESQVSRFPRSAKIYIAFTSCMFLVTMTVIFVKGRVG